MIFYQHNYDSVVKKLVLKTVSIVFFIFTYISGNLMLNNANISVDHRARYFRKMMLNTPTFGNNFDFIWIFSYSHLSSRCNKTLKC